VQATEIPVQLDATASLMDHTRDATVNAFQTATGTLAALGALNRQWVGFSPLSNFSGSFDAANRPFTWSGAAQGLNFGGSILLPDLNGATIPVTWNTANMTANGSLGALLLHHFNGCGNRAEVVVLDTATSADLGITKISSPPNPTLGQNLTFTITVTNPSMTAVTGVVVTDKLPAGLTYVSDDGGGAYVPATGLWTVGSLAASGSATLNVVATLTTTDPVANRAQITAASPLDTNPANNQAKVTLNAVQSADLSIDVSGPAGPVIPGASVTYTLRLLTSAMIRPTTSSSPKASPRSRRCTLRVP